MSGPVIVNNPPPGPRGPNFIQDNTGAVVLVVLVIVLILLWWFLLGPGAGSSGTTTPTIGPVPGSSFLGFS